MDIDATLVWSLDKLLGNQYDSLYIKVDKNTRFTNYFIASVPNNPDLERAIEQVVYNVNHYEPSMGVYHCTGPTVLHNLIINKKDINSKDRKYVCIQGTFTNEHFQYIDKPRGKWTHINLNELVKKEMIIRILYTVLLSLAALFCCMDYFEQSQESQLSETLEGALWFFPKKEHFGYMLTN